MSTSGNSLSHELYQRSNNYDPDWVIENEMGPNPLWLSESLAESAQSVHDMLENDQGRHLGLTRIVATRR